MTQQKTSPNLSIEDTKRNKEMVKLKDNGWSISALAGKYNLTTQRICQLIKRERERAEK